MSKRLSKFDEALLDIVGHYGIQNQARKLVEEVDELVEALLDQDEEKITEEVGDVSVVLRQLLLWVEGIKHQYRLDKSAIRVVERQKVARQHERMKGE